MQNENTFLVKLGARIKKKRQSMGYTQQEMAKMLEFKTRVSVNRIEMGKQGPMLEDLMKLCAIFKCRPNDLLPQVPKVKISKVAVRHVHDEAKFTWA